MLYKEYKKQIQKNKSNKDILKDILSILKDTNIVKKGYLKEYQRLNLISLVIGFLNMHNNIKHIKKVKTIYNINYIDNSINNDLINDEYLKILIEDINEKFDIATTNDYIVGLINLLNDNNYIYNTIGLKIVIAKYILSLKDIKDLKVFKISNNKLNNKFKFLVYKNDKIKNYTKLYYNKEYNLIIFNTLLHDNIVSVVLYDNTKINSIEDIVLTNVVSYDKSFKHIEDIKEYNKQYIDIEEQFLDNIKKCIAFLKMKKINVNDLSLRQKITLILNKEQLFYNNDEYYKIYLSVEEYLKNKDNFEYSLSEEKTTLKDYNMNNSDIINMNNKVKVKKPNIYYCLRLLPYLKTNKVNVKFLKSKNCFEYINRYNKNRYYFTLDDLL